MRKTLLALCVALLMIINVMPVSAATLTNNTTNIVPLQSKNVTLATSGHFKNYGESSTFYVSGANVKGFYITFSGDSNAYVDFTLYRNGKAITSGTYLADGQMHIKSFAFWSGGNCQFKFTSGSSNNITYAVSTN